MNVDDFLAQMKKTLADERTAIRKLDVKGVSHAAATKETLMKAVANCAPAERPALLAALKDLKLEFRRNLILLAHARDYIRDAVTLVTVKNPRRPRLQASL